MPVHFLSGAGALRPLSIQRVDTRVTYGPGGTTKRWQVIDLLLRCRPTRCWYKYLGQTYAQRNCQKLYHL